MYSFLSESQKHAFDLIKEGKNVFITGSAGTGKSYLLNFLKKEFSNRNFHITATTGIASINVGGVTLHSWAGLGIEQVPLNEILKKIFSAKGTNLRKKLLNAEILAIDEISMLSKNTFELLDDLLRKVRDIDFPFGGIQLVLFGDFLQLPPVKSDFFCFESVSWTDADIKIIELKEVFRQQDKRFVKLLNNIRFGIRDKEDLEILKERFNLKESGNIKPTILSTHNSIVDRINYDMLGQLPAMERVFKAEYDGNAMKVEFLKKNCVAQNELYLKIGAQVMMLKNTYQKDGIINGSIGIITGFSQKKQYPIVEFENGTTVTIAPDVWETYSYNTTTNELIIDATMIQIPLRLAWSITIHKSQGMTLDKVECDLKNTFSEGQAYVALSRARDLNGLYIKSFDINNIKANKKVIEFYNGIK